MAQKLAGRGSGLAEGVLAEMGFLPVSRAGCSDGGLGRVREEAAGLIEAAGQNEGVDGGQEPGSQFGGAAEHAKPEGEGMGALEVAWSQLASAGDGLGHLQAPAEPLGLVLKIQAPAGGVLRHRP